MRKLTYLAVLEPAKTGYSVYFPDIPGCISCGEDLEDAQKQAVEALGLHICGMEKDGDEIPLPSKKIQIDPETTEGYLVSPITVFPDLVKNELDNRAVKTNLTIPAWLKEMAEAQGVNYSKVFQVALMDYLGVSQPPKCNNKYVYSKHNAAEEQLAEGKVLDGDASLKSVREKYNV
jgi:predicted RNase H-like HicB family nuclease